MYKNRPYLRICRWHCTTYTWSWCPRAARTWAMWTLETEGTQTRKRSSRGKVTLVGRKARWGGPGGAWGAARQAFRKRRFWVSRKKTAASVEYKFKLRWKRTRFPRFKSTTTLWKRRRSWSEMLPKREAPIIMKRLSEMKAWMTPRKFSCLVSGAQIKRGEIQLNFAERILRGRCLNKIRPRAKIVLIAFPWVAILAPVPFTVFYFYGWRWLAVRPLSPSIFTYKERHSSNSTSTFVFCRGLPTTGPEGH